MYSLGLCFVLCLLLRSYRAWYLLLLPSSPPSLNLRRISDAFSTLLRRPPASVAAGYASFQLLALRKIHSRIHPHLKTWHPTGKEEKLPRARRGKQVVAKIEAKLLAIFCRYGELLLKMIDYILDTVTIHKGDTA